MTDDSIDGLVALYLAAADSDVSTVELVDALEASTVTIHGDSDTDDEQTDDQSASDTEDGQTDDQSASDTEDGQTDDQSASGTEDGQTDDQSASDTKDGQTGDQSTSGTEDELFSEAGRDDDAGEDVEIAPPDGELLSAAFENLASTGYVREHDDGQFVLTDEGETFADSFRTDAAEGAVTLTDLAVPLLEAVVDEYRERAAGSDLDDATRRALVAVRRALGRAYSNVGALQDARDAISEARSLASDGDDAREAVAATTDLARIYEAAGQFENARDYYDRATYRATEADLDGAAATALTDLGANYYESATDLDEARSALEDALERYQSAGDPLGECRARRLLTTVCYDAGDFEAALDHGDHALDLADEIANEEDAAFERSLALAALGRVHTDAGEYDHAIDRLEAAIDRAADGSSHECRARIWLADALLGADRLDEAEDALDDADALLEAGDLPDRLEPLVVIRRGRIALERGALDRAGELIDEANELGKSIGTWRPIVLSYHYDGLLKLEEGTGLWADEQLKRAKAGGEEVGEWDVARRAREKLDEREG